MIATLVVAAAVVSAHRPAAAQAASEQIPVVTLEEARRRALQVDPDIVASRSEVETASWERRAAMADLLTPQVAATGNYTRFSDPFFNFGTGNISPNAASATLEANYTLLGAGKLGQLRSSKASLASAEAGETASRFRTTLEADAAYYAVLASRELATVAESRLQRALEQLSIARVRVQAGDALASDSLQLLLEVNRARLEMLSRDSARVASQLRLGRQIGLTGPADAAPIDSSAPPPLPITLEQAVAEMRDRGPEIVAARAAERRASALLSAQTEDYLPEITIGAVTGAYDQELFPSALKRSQLAIGVRLPIWNAGQRELARARARADRDVARARRLEEERSAAERIAEVYHGYQTARAGIELAQVGVIVARENYRVQDARHREGAANILDVLEAQVALTESEATLVQARYAARLALAQIEALLGRRLFEDSGSNRIDR
jgi:multidrug efflux system outer membrane protein